MVVRFAMTLFFAGLIASTVFASSPPICEVYSSGIASFLPRNRALALRPISLSRYAWELVDLESNRIESFGEDFIFNDHFESMRVAPDEKNLVLKGRSYNIHLVNRDWGTQSIPFIDTFVLVYKADAAFTGSSVATVLGYAARDFNDDSLESESFLVLVQQESAGSSKWKVIARAQHGQQIKQLCNSISIAYDHNDKLYGLCSTHNGTYSVNVIDEKIILKRISAKTITNLEAAPAPGGMPAFFGFTQERNNNTVLKKLTMSEQGIDIEDIYKHPSDPGTIKVADQNNLIFYFYYHQYIAQFRNGKWDVRADDNPLSGPMYSVGAEPMRRLGSYSGFNAALFYSVETGAGWNHVEVYPESDFKLVTDVCSERL